MTESERLELIQTLRAGHCKHPNRVNICTECRAALERVLTETNR